MKKINFNYSKSYNFVKEYEVLQFSNFVKETHEMLHNKTGTGSEFLGWLDLPLNFSKDEFERIKRAAAK